jgi:hypothetical protein
MRIPIATLIAVCLMAPASFAQTTMPQPQQGIDGARPGRIPGVGESLPRSDRASNIGPETTRPGVAPSLPRPDVGIGAEPEAYLRAARDALTVGKTGLAQEALEMAETQMLHRSVMPGMSPAPADVPMVATVRDARMALGRGNAAEALSILQAMPAN